jgi:hypothetical protein
MRLRLLLILAIAAFASVAALAADVPANAITVTLTDTTVTRPSAVTGLLAALLGGGTEKLKRGELTVNGETFALEAAKKPVQIRVAGLRGDFHEDL